VRVSKGGFGGGGAAAIEGRKKLESQGAVMMLGERYVPGASHAAGRDCGREDCRRWKNRSFIYMRLKGRETRVRAMGNRWDSVWSVIPSRRRLFARGGLGR